MTNLSLSEQVFDKVAFRQIDLGELALEDVFLIGMVKWLLHLAGNLRVGAQTPAPPGNN